MRVAILCPGRGSYAEKQLRSLPEERAAPPEVREWIARAEELRRGYGLPPLVELDRAGRIDPKEHLRPTNASPLIWLVTMIDAAAAAREHRVTCVAGNSMGWYTALAVAGALDFDDGFELVQRMSLLQEEQQAAEGGGQVIYPVVGEDWREGAERRKAVENALASAGGEAFTSIRLGGYAVLAGTEAWIAHLLRSLPRTKLGANPYPFRLMQHGPYHTRLVEGVARRARETLAGLGWRAPATTLVDGRGARFTPWSTDAAELREYTLGEQVTTTFDFTASVRVCLREHAPERLLLPGPGNTLGGVCGQVLVGEGWRGIRSREDFERVQSSTEPVVVSMRR